MSFNRILNLANPASDLRTFDAIEQCWENHPASKAKLVGLVTFAGFTSMFGMGFGTPLIFRAIVLHGVLELRVNAIDPRELFSSYESMKKGFSEQRSLDLFSSDESRSFATFCDEERIRSLDVLQGKLSSFDPDDQPIILACLSQEGLMPIIERSAAIIERMLPQECVPRIVGNHSSENPVAITLNPGSPIFKITAPLKIVAIDFRGEIPEDKDYLTFTMEVAVDLSQKTATCRILSI